MNHLRPAIFVFALLTILTGGVYPLVVTGICRVLFPWKAAGSIIEIDGKPVGSSLIGQPFDRPEYFWSRGSGTSPVPYTAFNADKSTGSSGTNQGPTNPALVDAVKSRIESLRVADEAAGYARPPGQLVPVDLVTASGSGLDPHISAASAEYQAPRVAKARGLSEERVRELVRAHTEGRTFGVLGEPRVNVLELNLELDGKKAGNDLARRASAVDAPDPRG